MNKRNYYRGGGGYQNPQEPNHVGELRPPEVFVSKLGGRQPAVATDSSVASPSTDVTQKNDSPSAVMDSMDKLLAGPESPSKGFQWHQTYPRVDTPPLNVENPDVIRLTSMSDLSLIESNSEGTLSSNHHGLPLHSGESEGIHPLLDSQKPNGTGFHPPMDPLLPEGRSETTSMSPPNGKVPDPERDMSPRSIPNTLPKSIPNTSPESIPHNSPVPHLMGSSDNLVDTEASETTLEGLNLSESLLEETNHQKPPEGISQHPQAILNSQYYEPALIAISNRQQSTFDTTERKDPISVTQDHSNDYIDDPNHQKPSTEPEDHQEPFFDPRQNQPPNLIEPDPPRSTLDEPSGQKPASDERDHTDLASKERNQSVTTTTESDSPKNNFDSQNYPNAVLDTQSRSESRNNHESTRSRDLLPQKDREARLHRMQWRSLKTRSFVSEKRTELRLSRNKMSDVEAEFVKVSRQVWLNGGQDELTLKASFDSLQATRTEYASLEEEYNRLEERLDREVYELVKLEEKILKDSASVSESQDTDLESISDSSSEDEDSSKSPEALKEQQNPLYREYMSRLGDIGLHREEYSYLVSEHESLLEAEEVSQRHGREFPVEDQITLDKFDAREQKMREEREAIESDVKRLRRECIQAGLLPGEEDEEIDILQTSDGTVASEQAEYNIFPQLLDRPGKDEDEKKSKELLSIFRSGDIGDRITRWLLHKLRSSCSEVELLARYTEGLDRTVDTGKWQEDVLHFWFVDSATLPPSAYELDPTATAALSPTLTDPDKVEHEPFGEKHIIELIVRSSSISSALEFGMLLKLARMKGRSAVTM